MGILVNIVDTVEKLALENKLSQVASITLQVGELSAALPKFLRECYPAAVDRSVLLRDAELKIEVLAANSICHACGKVFGFTEHGRRCPDCGGLDSEIVSGREFFIKEIEAC